MCYIHSCSLEIVHLADYRVIVEGPIELWGFVSALSENVAGLCWGTYCCNLVTIET
jgi:hypothetical protein